MFALSNKIITLTLKVKVTKKHAKNASISETGLDITHALQLFKDENLCVLFHFVILTFDLG